MVKYLFWACDLNTGIFEELDEASYLKFKRMSKYKKEEMAQFGDDAPDRYEIPK